MIWWMTLALAAPPEGVDPDDFDRWEVAADKALDGPEGCWELTGALRVDAALHSPATAFTRSDTARFVATGGWSGRLDAGQWSRFDYELELKEQQDDDDENFEIPIFPVIGRIDQEVVNRAKKEAAAEEEPADDEGKGISISLGGDPDKKKKKGDEGDEPAVGAGDGAAGGAEAINLFQSFIDAWEPATAITFAQWKDDERYIELLQDFPIFETPNSPVVVVTSVFPEGGEGLSRLDAQFPKRVKVGEWPLKVTLMDTQFHLRQQQVGSTWLPQVEGFTLMAGVLGFTFGYEQQLTYATAQACVSEP